MRLIGVLAAVAVLALASIVVGTNVLQPTAASTRLSGVSVAVAGFSVEELAGDRHRLNLSIRVASDRDVDECLAFALDEPFAGRRLAALPDGCVRPLAGRRPYTLVFDRLDSSDLAFTSHTLVWGVAGGRCGIVLELFGVCVVDQAGTASIELPTPAGIPTFGPIGSLVPIVPLYSFRP